jgi:hypothetical protein
LGVTGLRLAFDCYGLVFAAGFKKRSMKKNTSSNAQDAGHTEAQGRNIPTSGRKGKANNSQAIGDMMQESEEQKAGRNKNKQKANDKKQDSAGKRG